MIKNVKHAIFILIFIIKHAIFIKNKYYNKRSEYFNVKIEYYKNWSNYINNIMQSNIKIE